jgi:hypothetical protein
MKLLGRFYKEVAEQYRKLLSDQDIVTRLEFPANSSPYNFADTTLVNDFSFNI